VTNDRRGAAHQRRAAVKASEVVFADLFAYAGGALGYLAPGRLAKSAVRRGWYSRERGVSLAAMPQFAFVRPELAITPHAFANAARFATLPHVPSTVVSMLARLDEADLLKMQSSLEADRARVEAEATRIGLELDQVTEALTRKARPGTRQQRNTGRRPSRPGATQGRIMDAIKRIPQPASPAQIIADMEGRGIIGNRGTIHNAIARLVKNGELDRVGEGQYQLASPNGSGEEPHENATSSASGGYERQDASTPIDGLR